MDLICFAGNAGVGKDTAAEILIDDYGYKKIAFADEIKVICSDTFGIEHKYFTDTELKEKPFETPIKITQEHLSNIIRAVSRYDMSFSDTAYRDMSKVGLGVKLESPRHMMQFVGTELVRGCLDNNAWLIIFSKKCKEINKVVVTDVRMKNEAEFLKSLGGKVAKINRKGAKSVRSHFSENGLGEFDFDVTIDNDSSIDHLHCAVEGLL